MKKNIRNLGLALIAFLLSACTSEETQVSQQAPQEIGASYSDVNLSDIPVALKRNSVSDKRNLRDVVELAFSLSDNGQHSDAAEVFMQAHKDFSSPNKSLEQSLLSAAICEYFQAGLLDRVRAELETLDSYRLSIYDRFSDNPSIVNIRKILAQRI